jgi:pilus assembly protein Flp/PilA
LALFYDLWNSVVRYCCCLTRRKKPFSPAEFTQDEIVFAFNHIGMQRAPCGSMRHVSVTRVGVRAPSSICSFGFCLEKLEMSKISKGFVRFFREEDAPTMVEYGLLITVIALVVLGTAITLGTNVSGWFGNAASVTPNN